MFPPKAYDISKFLIAFYSFYNKSIAGGNNMVLTEELQQVFPETKKLSLVELKEAIASLEELLLLVPDYCTEPNKLPYGRNVLLRNADYEIVVIYLPGNRATAIHDHGDSIGCALVVQGELLNISYTLDSNGYPLKKEEVLVQSGNMMEATYGQIHEMKNPRKEAMISLHVYSPPLKNIKAYVPYSEVLDYVI
jgi:cysteine dioxygenase